MISPTEGWLGLDNGEKKTNPLFYLQDNQWTRRNDFNLETFRTYVLDALSSDNVWVCSFAPSVAETYYGLRINRFNGTAWSHYILEYGIWPQCMAVVSETEAWIAGNSAALLHITEEGYMRMQIPIPQELQMKSHIFDILMEDNGSGWAVGGQGLIARYENECWTPAVLPEQVNKVRFWDADLSSPDTLWVVGDSGTILKWEDNSWTVMPSPVVSGFYAIDMVSPRDGWIVGSEGVILRFNGTGWESYFSPTKETLFSVKMFSSTEGWISAQNVILKAFAGDINIYRQRSEEKNPLMDREIVTGLTAVDINNDQNDDLFFMPQKFIYENDGKGLFKNISTSSGLTELEGAYYSFGWGDVDNDKDLDLYLISFIQDANKLLINNGHGKFSISARGPAEAGGYWNTCYFLDIDNDNDLDLYVERTWETQEVAAGDYIYLNDGWGNFQLRKTSMGKKEIQRLVLWGDLDGDLDLDAVFPRLSEDLIVYRNDGMADFKEITAATGIPENMELSHEARSAFLFDADIDGDLDLLVISNVVQLLYNDGNFHFSDTRIFPGIENYVLTDLENYCSDMGDINNDGREDFIMKTTDQDGTPKIYCYIQEANGSFLNIAPQIGIENLHADQVLLNDMDNDGDLDMYITRGRTSQTNLYYENQLNNGNYLYVQPRGVISNSMAIGAQIRIFETGHINETDYLKGYKQVGVGMNPRNTHNITRTHFGLDGSKKYDIEILFSSGRRVVKEKVPPGGTVTIYEYPFIIRFVMSAYRTLSRVITRINWFPEIIKFIIFLGALFFVRFVLIKKTGAELIIRRWYVSVLLAGGYLVVTGALAGNNHWYVHLISFTSYLLFIFIIFFMDKWLSIRMRSRYVGPYRIIEKIAEGGMGRIYKAYDIIKKSCVAIKILHPLITENENNKQRFLREGKIMEQLDHPHIVKVFETGEINGQGFICMEFLEGMTLAELIKMRGPMDPDVVLAIVLPVCEALSYIHKNGIIHRDVKSENIFISGVQSGTRIKKDSIPDQVKLMDFGLAQAQDFISITHADTVMGTLAYMAPEHFLGTGIDERTDIYSLGIVMYEALSGRLPHQGTGELGFIQEIINSSYFPVSRYNADVPVLLDKIVCRTLTKEPGARYQCTDALIDDLHKVNALTPLPQEKNPKKLPAGVPAHMDNGNLNLEPALSAKARNGSLPDSSLSSKTAIYYNQYKNLKAVQMEKEADRALDNAFKSIISEKKFLQSREERQLVKDYHTRSLTIYWKKSFEKAKVLFKEGEHSEARDRIIQCFKQINLVLALLNEEQKESYLETHNVNEVVVFMEQMLPG